MTLVELHARQCFAVKPSGDIHRRPPRRTGRPAAGHHPNGGPPAARVRRPRETRAVRTIVVPPAASAAPASCAACSAAPPTPTGPPSHRHRQHRRRHHAVRPAGLPRPGHRHVHPRRRHPRGAGLGPGRRDLRRPRRAGRLRRRARSGSGSATATSPPTSLRTQMLDAGYPLGEVTQALCARWGLDRPGRPAAADERRPGRDPRRHRRPGRARRAAGGALPGVLGAAARRADRPRRSSPVGAEQARPGPGVLEAIAAADLVLLPPSNPVVSIGTVLAVPGIREALAATPAPVVGLSPIVGGAPVRGMADKVLAAIGVETTAGRGGAATTAAGRRRAARRLAGRRARTPTRSPTSRPPASPAAPCRC